MPERELLVVRHGKSSWKKKAPADLDRPLAGRGKRDAGRVARWIEQQGLAPVAVFSSPAKRALQTVRVICKGLGLDREAVFVDERIYFGGLEETLAVLAEAEGDRVLLVGHNPDLEELVLHLAGDGVPEPPDGKLFPTCAVARFLMPADWKELPRGCGELIDLVRPRNLPE